MPSVANEGAGKGRRRIEAGRGTVEADQIEGRGRLCERA